MCHESKSKLYKASVFSIPLYGCETQTLLTVSEKRVQGFETKCLLKLLRIPFLEHKTNDWFWSKINFIERPQEPLLVTVKRQKVAWFGHVTRHDSLSITILQGTLESGRRRSRQRKGWMEDVKSRRPCLSCRKDWKRICAESSLMSPR